MWKHHRTTKTIFGVVGILISVGNTLAAAIPGELDATITVIVK